jgi:hypothetical protein
MAGLMLALMRGIMGEALMGGTFPSAGGTPANAITFNGAAITFAGATITWSP